MRWLSFILLAATALTLQSAIAPRFELFGVRPDWLLVVVVFFAMRAAPRDAAIGAWIIGGCADLMTIERAGLMALTYTLVAVSVTLVRDYVFRDRALTQLLLTLVMSVFARLAWTVYSRLLYDPGQALLVDLTLQVLIASIYTAVWAPLLHKALLRISRVFGLARPRYTYAGQQRMGTSGV